VATPTVADALGTGMEAEPFGAPGERASPPDRTACVTAPRDSEGTGVMAHDIPVANPASETAGEPEWSADERRRSIGPERVTRGGTQALWRLWINRASP